MSSVSGLTRGPRDEKGPLSLGYGDTPHRRMEHSEKRRKDWTRGLAT